MDYISGNKEEIARHYFKEGSVDIGNIEIRYTNGVFREAIIEAVIRGAKFRMYFESTDDISNFIRMAEFTKDIIK